MHQFYKLLSLLKKRIKPSYPVFVYIVEPKKMNGDWADCKFTGKRFVIKLARADWKTLYLLLIHEMAHIDCWFKPSKDDHDAEWGKSYAKCWHVACEEN